MRLGADAKCQYRWHDELNSAVDVPDFHDDVVLGVFDPVIVDPLILFRRDIAVVIPHLELLLRRVVLEEVIRQILAKFFFFSGRHRPRCLKRPAALQDPSPRLRVSPHDALRVTLGRYPFVP